MLSKTLIKSPKTEISISPWKAGKIPANEFTLRRGQKPISQGSTYKWRMVAFLAAGCRCKIWINFNYDKLIYRATLGYEVGDLYKIICVREFHPSEPGWHCHVALSLDRGVSNLTHRDLLRHPRFDNSAVSVCAMGVETEREATERALRFFRVDVQGPLI